MTQGACRSFFAGGVHYIPHSDGTVAIGSTTLSGTIHARPDRCNSLMMLIAGGGVLRCPSYAMRRSSPRWAACAPAQPLVVPRLWAAACKPGHFVANGGFKIGFGQWPQGGTSW